MVGNKICQNCWYYAPAPILNELLEDHVSLECSPYCDFNGDFRSVKPDDTCENWESKILKLIPAVKVLYARWWQDKQKLDFTKPKTMWREAAKIVLSSSIIQIRRWSIRVTVYFSCLITLIKRSLKKNKNNQRQRNRDCWKLRRVFWCRR